MDKFDRFQMVHRIFSSHRRPVPLAKIAERMECTPKTVQRTFEQMRNMLDAPIEYFSEGKGWQYNDANSDAYLVAVDFDGIDTAIDTPAHNQVIVDQSCTFRDVTTAVWAN